jgi:hypothetical protein
MTLKIITEMEHGSQPTPQHQTDGEKEDTVVKNRCMECGVDMGDMNPRQLCGKLYCFMKSSESAEG